MVWMGCEYDCLFFVDRTYIKHISPSSISSKATRVALFSTVVTMAVTGRDQGTLSACRDDDDATVPERMMGGQGEEAGR